MIALHVYKVLTNLKLSLKLNLINCRLLLTCCTFTGRVRAGLSSPSTTDPSPGMTSWTTPKLSDCATTIKCPDSTKMADRRVGGPPENSDVSSLPRGISTRREEVCA